MKKILLACFVASTIFACSPTTEKTNSSNYPANAVGYNLDSSANIELVKGMTKAFEAMDSVSYRSFYAANAKFHDNNNEMTLDQNVANFNFFMTKGITVKIEKMDPIWEAVNDEASPEGVTNYVISFQHLVFTKGDKQVKVIMNVVNAMKDGKIVEEWGLYDSRELAELMK